MKDMEKNKSAYERYGGYNVDYKIVMNFELMLRFSRHNAN